MKNYLTEVVLLEQKIDPCLVKYKLKVYIKTKLIDK